MFQNVTSTREEVRVRAELCVPAPKLIRPHQGEHLLGTYYAAEIDISKMAYNTNSYIKMD